MVENLEAVLVDQTFGESRGVDVSVTPVASAGGVESVVAASVDSRAAACATVPVSGQINAAGMYAVLAAGFSQSGSNIQGSQVFAVIKRSARR